MKLTHEETHFLQIIHTTPTEELKAILEKAGLSPEEIKAFEEISNN